MSANFENKKVVVSEIEELAKNDVDVTVDNRSEKIGYKIRDARLSRLPYMLIVGEKEDSVDEDIVPEDGVFTLRYTANHLDDEIRKLQTFAFADNNINKVKKLKVSFSKKSVLGSDVYDESYVLPAGTEVKLYYTKDNGDTVVGYYKLPVASDSFYATDFKISRNWCKNS